MHRVTALASVALLPLGWAAVAQSPRAASPERPTVATHAYAVAPGYLEVEQGLSARGVSSLDEATSWDVNIKVGVTSYLQLGLFGPGYARTGAGHGIGDWGLAVKLRTAFSARVAGAIVPAGSTPTGSVRHGLGAGRVLGQLPLVLSIDGPAGVHTDLNAGALGIGAGRPQWLTTASFARSFGRLGVTAEVFRIGPGAAGPRQAGLLGALPGNSRSIDCDRCGRNGRAGSGLPRHRIPGFDHESRATLTGR